jgi:hypothetical protein
VNLPRRLILDQKVQCLVTTEFIYLYLFESVFLSPLSLALIMTHNFNHLLRPKPKTYQQAVSLRRRTIAPLQSNRPYCLSKIQHILRSEFLLPFRILLLL